ncbi:MAG: AAA-like domain-containing protein [Lachnospiraceae bacterium]|nr:AAA-like domain-containing protein [Lachnospiraceae bacterium]
MAKIFNVYGACRPDEHYMVDLTSRLEAIKKMVDAGDYFTINRGRQYGKTTTLQALASYLKKDYIVVSLDFQKLGADKFVNENQFSIAFAKRFLRKISLDNELDEDLLLPLKTGLREERDDIELLELFDYLSDICAEADKPIVLMIDEVDASMNNQVFLSFLAQLRADYLDRRQTPTFQSVILAGVHDIRNIRRKIRPERPSNAKRFFNDGRDLPPTEREGAIPHEAHQPNSPWNIAADFDVPMSFDTVNISSMLNQYENDYHTGMSVAEISKVIYDYTSGYPVLVSRICKILDEKIAGSPEYPDKSKAWTMEGLSEAIKRIIKEDNPLYESLLGKLTTYPELKPLLKELFFNGSPIPYVATASYIKDAAMFGFIQNENETAVISNRIFEAVLYNNFISEEFIGNKLYEAGAQERNQFIVGGHLDVRRILEKFIETFSELYGEEDEKFLEKVGRKYFLLYLKPIINGIGNYSIEPQTRNSERMDVVIYYKGEQNILELKLWRGNSYNERGEKQLSGYLDYFHMKKGYMLSFNFNKKKTRGVKEIVFGDKILIEGVV